MNIDRRLSYQQKVNFVFCLKATYANCKKIAELGLKSVQRTQHLKIGFECQFF